MANTERGPTANGTRHISYPHHPGEIYDCPACESQCFCEPGMSECVYCSLRYYARAETSDDVRVAAHVAAWNALSVAEQRERYDAGIALQAGSIQL